MIFPLLRSFFFVVLFLAPLFTFSQFNPPIGPGNSYNFTTTATSGSFFNIGNQVAAGVRTIEVWVKPANNITSTLGNPVSIIVRDYNNGSGLSTNEFGLYFSPSNWGNGGTMEFYRRIGSTKYNINSDQS